MKLGQHNISSNCLEIIKYENSKVTNETSCGYDAYIHVTHDNIDL
jgi:hypothetical protein